MRTEQREWLRREIDRAKRLRIVEAEIEKVEYRIEHPLGDPARYERRRSELEAQAAELAPPPSPDGYCMAIVNLGPRWTMILAARCSRRASTGRFCRTHERRRVAEFRVLS